MGTQKGMIANEIKRSAKLSLRGLGASRGTKPTITLCDFFLVEMRENT